MSTKYAKARDIAGQWRSEYQKVKRENASLRRVYAEAKKLADAMPRDEQTFALRDALRNAEFAVEA